jgi:transcriptional regulator with XRE-family HTH domain
MTHVGRLIADARQAKGWSEKDLVMAAGYRKVDKGLRRLRRIEDGSDPLPDERRLAPFAKALGLDGEAVLLALCSDFDALDAPMQPQVVIRWMPAFYGRMALPEGCTEERAVELAKRFSAEQGLRCCVMLSRVRSIYVEPNGTETLSFQPPGCSISMSAGLRDRIQMRLAKRLGGMTVERAPPTGKP